MFYVNCIINNNEQKLGEYLSLIVLYKYMLVSCMVLSQSSTYYSDT